MLAPRRSAARSEIPEPGGASPISMARRALLSLLVATACWSVVEAASFAGLWLRDGTRPSVAGWRAERRRAVASAALAPGVRGAANRDGAVLLHPFLGFTAERRDAWGRRFHVDELGFVQAAAPAAAGPRGEFRVGILGGSVAQMLALHHGDSLAMRLERSPALRGRRVRVIDLAMGGYKQPQQLISLVWTQAYGARLDAAVLLDGFNDVVLPEAENRGARVHPFYPRGWRTLIESAVGPERLLVAGELAQAERRRRRRAGMCAAQPLAWSAACELLWSAGDRKLQARGAELRRSLERAFSEQPAGALGPPLRRGGARRRLRESAEFWGRSAVMMRQLCAQRGIVFLHFLQPNQYVAGSKPMGEEERRLALRPDGAYGAAAAAGYPELQRVGRELNAAGEPFADLTALFRAIAEPVYADDCCHFNDRGNEMLAERIAADLRRALEQRPAPRAAAGGHRSRKPTSETPAAASATGTLGSQRAAVSSCQR